MRTIVKLFFGFAFILGCAPGVVKKETLFTYNLSAGQNLGYESTTNIKTTMVIGEGVQETATKIYLRTNQSVVAADSLIVLSIKIDTVAIENRVNGQLAPVPTPDVLKGKTWSIKMNRSGKVVESKGLEDVKLFGEGGGDLAKQYGEFLSFLPGYPIKIGDRWEKKAADESQTTTSRYTLVKFEKYASFDCAKIAVENEVKMKRNVEQGGGKVTMDLQGTGTGEIYFAVKEGMLISYNQRSSIKGNGEVSGPMLPQPMTFPISIEQDALTILVH